MILNFLGHVSTPRCVRTPVKECVPRTVETPRKVKIAKSFTFFPPPLKRDVHSFPSSNYRISKFDPICRSARLLWMCLRTPPSLSVARRSSPPRMYSLSLFRHFKKKMTHWHFSFQQTPRCTQTSEESHITESIASTDTVKIEEGVPVDAQTLGRASNVLHRQKAKLISKSNLISKARFQQTGV